MLKLTYFPADKTPRTKSSSIWLVGGSFSLPKILLPARLLVKCGAAARLFRSKIAVIRYFRAKMIFSFELYILVYYYNSSDFRLGVLVNSVP